MDPIETYATLYDEAVEREHGKDHIKPEPGTAWNTQSAAAQRMARKRDADIAETIDSYVESVAAFDETQRLLEGPHRHRADAYREALPTELVSASESFDYFRVEADSTRYDIRVTEWVALNVDPIVKADDPAAFERKLRRNIERIDARRPDGYTAGQLEAIYDQWDAQGRDWAAELWTFVTDDNLGLKELAEERRHHNRRIAAHAQNLQEQLGAELDAYAQPSRFERLKERIL